MIPSRKPMFAPLTAAHYGDPVAADRRTRGFSGDLSWQIRTKVTKVISSRAPKVVVKAAVGASPRWIPNVNARSLPKAAVLRTPPATPTSSTPKKRVWLAAKATKTPVISKVPPAAARPAEPGAARLNNMPKLAAKAIKTRATSKAAQVRAAAAVLVSVPARVPLAPVVARRSNMRKPAAKVTRTVDARCRHTTSSKPAAASGPWPGPVAGGLPDVVSSVPCRHRSCTITPDPA